MSRGLGNDELQTDEHVQLMVPDLAGHEMNSVNCETFITGPCVPRQDKNTTSTQGHAVHPMGQQRGLPTVGVGGAANLLCGSRCGRERAREAAEGRGWWAVVPRESRAVPGGSGEEGAKVGMGWGGGEESEDETSEERTQGGTSPGVQWLRLRAPRAGAGSIPGQGTNPTCCS